MEKALKISVIFCFICSACLVVPQDSPTPFPKEVHTLATEISLPAPTISPTSSHTTPPEAPIASPMAGQIARESESMAELLERLGGYPCPDSDFTCLKVETPMNHFDAQDERTIDVLFGVLPASGERKGVFVVANGGPGVSGLLSADAYVPYYDPRLLEHFDIVFFDQRGVNLSGGLQCIRAATEFYRSDWDASSPAKEELLLDAAQTFAEDCVAEMGQPDLLPYMDTRQAVEDLDAFRQIVGIEKFWLYGESYGSQFAQTYASSHPDRLEGLILDGTVDLVLSGFDFLEGQARAFNDVMLQLLEFCNEDEACADSVGGDAVAAYDLLAASLKNTPIQFDFPLPSGGTAPRELSFSDFETAAGGYMYSETARMIFLRALASYARDGTLVPLARMLHDALVLDPGTLEPVLDPSYSDAVYYAVECRDYSYLSGTVEESALAYLQRGDSIDENLPRFAALFYGDLPCVFWPDAQDDPSRPAPLLAENLPTLVLNAESDPVTPISNARAVHTRLADGYLITETGGPHIIFAWGLPCVDDPVTAFLIDDQVPEDRETSCEGVLADEFVPPAASDASEYENPLEIMADVDNEIYYLPEYYYWDFTMPTSVGCPFGGTLHFEPSNEGELFELSGCAFSEGFVMSGEGYYNYETELFTLDVSVSGPSSGHLTYLRDAEWALQLNGEYNGQEIELSQ